MSINLTAIIIFAILVVTMIMTIIILFLAKDDFDDPKRANEYPVFYDSPDDMKEAVKREEKTNNTKNKF
jgi:hypothetical protein